MLSLLAAVLVSQVAPAPVKQPGTNELFFKVTRAVEDRLQRKDFYGAERAMKALPKRTPLIQWDDSQLPANLKAEYAAARDLLIKELNAQFVNLNVKLALAPKGVPGDIKVGFAPTLPGEPNSRGSVHFASPSPAEPRVEAVFAIRRGSPPMVSEQNDIYSDLGHAVLAYFGMAESPVPGVLSHRYDNPLQDRIRIHRSEVVFVRNNLMIVDSLVESVRKKRPVTPSDAQARLDTTEIVLPDTVQGEVPSLSFQVTNLGNATLRIFVRPDCGCLTSDPVSNALPGDTVLIRGSIDTREFVGNLEKKFFVTTNDPQRPTFVIPVRVKVKPLYRMVVDGGNVLSRDTAEKPVDVFMWTAEGLDLKPERVQVDGLPNTVTFQPWEGTVADPEMGEGPLPRKGYRFTISGVKPPTAGRFGLTMSVATANERFPILRQSFFVQTGIVALPGSVYFGEIGQTPRRASFMVSRPDRGFKITKIESNVPAASAVFVATKDDREYRVTVMLNGKQEKGAMSGMVKVHTDDPAQPTIFVPIQAQVR